MTSANSIEKSFTEILIWLGLLDQPTLDSLPHKVCDERSSKESRPQKLEYAWILQKKYDIKIISLYKYAFIPLPNVRFYVAT